MPFALLLCVPALQASVPEPWAPSIRRRPRASGESLTLAGWEDVVDGAILTVSVRRRHDLRRADGDAPQAVSERLDRFDRIPTTRTARVKGRAWEHTMVYPKDALTPGLYSLALEFDPTAQPAAVREKLPRDVTPFARSAEVLLVSGDDARLIAEDVRRVASAIRAIGKEFEAVAEAAEHGRVTRGLVQRVWAASVAGIAALEPYSETSPVFRTISQLLMIPGEIGRGLAPNSSGKEPEDDDTGLLVAAALEALTEARRMFPVEFHLHMRTILADVRDRMWAAYVAARDGRPTAWAGFRAEYVPTRRVLTRGHEEMMKHETEAEYYIKRDEAEETSIGGALESLEKLFKQCDERLKDPEAPAPDELAGSLEKLLPPPRGGR